MCENVRCCKEKGLYGCRECPELAGCTKGFCGSPEGSLCKPNAMFIAKYGQEAYVRFLKESKLELSKENGAEENFALMEEKYLIDQVRGNHQQKYMEGLRAGAV